mmetsp:Transcript_64187/g.150499  ORF Transcript_64187/g.150499 Transcript_64187/m.150499 type:complete len:204 (-) Transcript_64187:1982-2593(-)
MLQVRLVLERLHELRQRLARMVADLLSARCRHLANRAQSEQHLALKFDAPVRQRRHTLRDGSLHERHQAIEHLTRGCRCSLPGRLVGEELAHDVAELGQHPPPRLCLGVERVQQARAELQKPVLLHGRTMIGPLRQLNQNHERVQHQVVIICPYVMLAERDDVVVNEMTSNNFVALAKVHQRGTGVGHQEGRASPEQLHEPIR